jgi:hypothetical protein
MEKEFIPYEQALALKELGFDEPCFGRYGNDSKMLYKDYSKELHSNYHTIAPLFQQAFRWFREKHDLVIEQCVPFQRLYSTEDDHFEILEFGYRIYSFDQYRGGLRDKIEWDGYGNSNEEEAELECLKKLIEIVKEK